MPGKGARRTRLGWDIGKRPVGCGIIISRASAASIKDSINKENGGVHTARNEGIRIANGDYITFIDIDDWIEEDYILTLIKIIESKNIDLAICNYKDVYIESNKEEYSSNDNGEDREINISELIDERFFFNGLINPCWGKLYKMSIIKGQGIRFESLKLSEDTLFNLNYLSFCKNIFI